MMRTKAKILDGAASGVPGAWQVNCKALHTLLVQDLIICPPEDDGLLSQLGDVFAHRVSAAPHEGNVGILPACSIIAALPVRKALCTDYAQLSGC